MFLNLRRDDCARRRREIESRTGRRRLVRQDGGQLDFLAVDDAELLADRLAEAQALLLCYCCHW